PRGHFAPGARRPVGASPPRHAAPALRAPSRQPPLPPGFRARLSVRCESPATLLARRGAGAVERGGLENRWRPKGRPWVQIPPPPLGLPRAAVCPGAGGKPKGGRWAAPQV